VFLGYSADGANATFIFNGGTAPGAYGARFALTQSATAGNSTIILNGGVNGGDGSVLYLDVNGKGGNARLQVYGNSVADLENPGGVILNTIGSIEGDGQIRLADTQLTVGGNDLSTTFSGLIEDYGANHETGGSLVKIGRGTLALTHDNTFTGGVR
jgi:autotransporter-associated beta strand protein